MSKHRALAFDFGASSGRAMLGRFDGEAIDLQEIHRFQNDPVLLHGTLYWDALRLFHEMQQGLLTAKHEGTIDSIGFDTWGVDFGLLDEYGRLLENPIHYRDSRTDGMVEELAGKMSESALYKKTGTEPMQINTIYQLLSLAKNRPELLARAETALMMPDLFAYFLTKEKGSEYTISSSSGLLDPHAKAWNKELFQLIGVKPDLFPAVVMPGTKAGLLSEEISAQLGIDRVPVYRVTSHDTASAVLAVPAEKDDYIYISSGTWSLMGIEVREPIINEETFQLNFTNEGGVDGTTRFLKNITGMWLLEQCRKEWKKTGVSYSYPTIVELASSADGFRSLVDPDDPSFANPANMVKAIVDFCTATGQPVPRNHAQFIRCIFDSLALLYADVLHELAQLRGEDFSQLHIVGGGCQNTLLNQLCADACGIRVIAGPVEASTLGNIGIQLMTLDELNNVDDFRQVVSATANLTTFTPNPDSEIAHYVARIHSTRQTKELCA